ncbi:MAG: hypothetical protein K8M05_01800 [Deltaproteobacteria bacterium]|nr:hypothetical protein [Kofleriaceae bacterium]
MHQDASLTIRLPSAVKSALEDAAAREFRTVSQYCVVVLAKHLGVPLEPRGQRNTRARRRGRRA